MSDVRPEQALMDRNRLQILLSQLLAWLIIIIIFGSACTLFNAVLQSGRTS